MVQQLTGAAGSWTGSGTISYAYQWYRCDPSGAHCSSIHGATKATYTQVAKDVGQTIGFAVHATDTTGTMSAYASLVGPVAAANATLISTAQPTITGTPKQSQTLQVTNGAWNQTPTSIGYQWQRCNPNGRLCTPVPGATASSYDHGRRQRPHTPRGRPRHLKRRDTAEPQRHDRPASLTRPKSRQA